MLQIICNATLTAAKYKNKITYKQKKLETVYITKER